MPFDGVGEIGDDARPFANVLSKLGVEPPGVPRRTLGAPRLARGIP